MTAHRFVLMLFALTALQTDALPLRAAPFNDTSSALVDDVSDQRGIPVRAGGPQGSVGEPYVGRPVLEPGTMFLMGSGLLGIGVWARLRWARRR